MTPQSAALRKTDSRKTDASPAASSSMRTGDEYLRSLKDGRNVYLDGEKVKDVTTHPALRAGARTIAGLFDLAADPAKRDLMTFTSPKTGEPVWRAYQIPKTHEDLKARRLFHHAWAEETFGLFGRSPDHVAAFFTGYAATPQVFAQQAGQQFADNVVKFYEYMRDNHVYASYAIVPPQIDRSKRPHQQTDPTLYAGVVKERDDGIVISGGQQLATGGVYSDYLHLSCIHPLMPGDENYANCVAIPINDPGLKLYPRRPFAKEGMNSYDYPLSSRFDESDSFVVLDNVFVPWERVFIYKNTQLSRDQWWATPAHSLGNHQAQTRYAVKLRFMLGLAKRMNEMTGNDSNPAVATMMGELAAHVAMIETMLLSHEATGELRDGVMWPSYMALYPVMSMQSEVNGKMLEMVRELSGSAMITLPSSAQDFENPEMMHDISRFMASGTADAKSRIAVMRMLWDFVGTEFGSRHQQYEKFYGGASFLIKMNVNRFYDWKRATSLVDKALALPPVE